MESALFPSKTFWASHRALGLMARINNFNKNEDFQHLEFYINRHFGLIKYNYIQLQWTQSEKSSVCLNSINLTSKTTSKAAAGLWQGK